MLTIASGVQNVNAAKMDDNMVLDAKAASDTTNSNKDIDVTHPDHIETVNIEVIETLDDSVASADELVPKVPESGEDLNLQIPTIQQSLLML